MLKSVILLIFISLPACFSCPPSWKQHNGTCYFFSYQMESWQDALIVCKEPYLGSLVEINNAQENRFLVTEASRQGISRFWIGARNNMLGLGDWMWTHSKTHMVQGYTNWAPGYPTNHMLTRRPIGPSCAMMLNGQWIDRECTHAAHYVCEL